MSDRAKQAAERIAWLFLDEKSIDYNDDVAEWAAIIQAAYADLEAAIAKQCKPGGEWMSYADLEAENERLRAEREEVRALCQRGLRLRDLMTPEVALSRVLEILEKGDK